MTVEVLFKNFFVFVFNLLLIIVYHELPQLNTQ